MVWWGCLPCGLPGKEYKNSFPKDHLVNCPIAQTKKKAAPAKALADDAAAQKAKDAAKRSKKTPGKKG